jgi:putative photosynthetic complex assembly protein 2
MGTAVLVTVLLWWFSTGLLILLCAMPPATFKWSFAAGFLLAAASVYGVAASAWQTGETAAYKGFLSALGVWAWLEMGFLMGFVTGPRRDACPPEARGWQRFRLAFATLIYHELTIAASAAALVWLTWGAPNQTGTLAFLILTVMRISAKLNIFLGVPELTDMFLPARLSYLKSYFQKRRFNALFPVSMLGSAVAAWALFTFGYGPGSNLLLTLLLLGVAEHLFMVLPVRDAVLFLWALPPGGAKPTAKSVP